VTFRQNWGQSRVYFHNDSGRLTSIPAEWTDLLGPDPFAVIAQGRSAFRVVDLLELVSLVKEFPTQQQKGRRRRGVK
jgi:hypothetical protein